MKIAVVDADDTLLFGGRVSRLCWSLSFLFQRLGRRLQYGNEILTEKLQKYDQVIVLTSRDVKDTQFTMEQLERKGLHVDKIICCPRKQVLTRWKVTIIQELATKYEIDWIDDVFEEGFAPELPVSVASHVKVMMPEALSQTKKTSQHEAGLESL